MMDRDVILSVGQVNGYIKRLLSYDELLSRVTVEGEISNYTRASSGHLYFSLKDNSGKIKCVMFRGNTFGLKFEPKDGMKVILEGSIDVYERNGEYQLKVSAMKKKGIGDLYEKYQQLLEKLRKMGYFDESIKKKIPSRVDTVAVVTSPTGAAIRDVITVINRRNKNIKIIVCPVLVQGVGSGDDVARMIRFVNELKLADVIITGRGGGSIEELWTFNEPVVAQAVFDSEIPVVSSVGHETDFTICDFVADYRAATPSMAGEIVSTPLSEIEGFIDVQENKILRNIEKQIREYELKLSNIMEKPVMRKPEAYIENLEQYVDSFEEGICSSYLRKMEILNEKLDSREKLIRSLSFESVLNRGYAIIKDGSDVVSSIKELEEGTEVTVQMRDGSFTSEVKSVTGK